MTTINELRAQLQGYVAPQERPACRNCWGCNEGSQSCAYGAFAIELDGWCPMWIPTTAWADKNKHACTKMGMSMGDNLRAPDHDLVREA